jgi:protocatechuate 3,4-dioxygenase beta subunit
MTQTTEVPDADPLREAREQALTDQVVASFAGADSERYREILESLVRHLHAFVRDVRLTDAEWHTAVDFLTRTGHACDDRRQEFVLLSDVLGISMLTVTVNQVPDPAVTESTVFGPFFVSASPEVAPGGDLSAGAPGQPCWVQGTVRGLHGEPVAGARIEVWEADENGLYDVQYDRDRTANRGHLFTDSDGGFRFWAVRPSAYPVPTDGPVGELLSAAARGAMRPAHIHFMITAAGYRKLTTHVFAAGDDYLARDAVFGVKPSLIAEFVQPSPADPAPPGAPPRTTWSSLTYDFVLATEEASAVRAAGRDEATVQLGLEDPPESVQHPGVQARDEGGLPCPQWTTPPSDADTDDPRARPAERRMANPQRPPVRRPHRTEGR